VTDRYSQVTTVLWRVLFVNLLVAAAKIALGYATGAVSILSDGFHSLTDSASNVVALVGVSAARRPPDADHPYGHRKYETMASLAMANPVPEIFPLDAKAAGARVAGSGRSDFPNQVNNVLCFPGIFRGALDVRAREINEEMKIAAAHAIADLITPEELNDEYVIVDVFDSRVAPTIAKAVAEAARRTGVARL
jgi:malate dehydrogenase (oxaloacetate-decarboxylating)